MYTILTYSCTDQSRFLSSTHININLKHFYACESFREAHGFQVVGSGVNRPSRRKAAIVRAVVGQMAERQMAERTYDRKTSDPMDIWPKDI